MDPAEVCAKNRQQQETPTTTSTCNIYDNDKTMLSNYYEYVGGGGKDMMMTA
jgi:hypothetical protein